MGSSPATNTMKKRDDYYCKKEATKSYKLKKKDKSLYFCDEHYAFAMGLVGLAKSIVDEKTDVA